jgi:hypothetical protein
MRILLLLFGISGWLIGRSGEIDGLRTQHDVVRFVRKVDAVYKRIPIFREGGADTGAMDNRYFKLDMDGNGRVALVVNGSYLLVILDLGNGHYNGRVKRIKDYGERGTFGLRLLYDWFFRYRKKVSWRRDNV